MFWFDRFVSSIIDDTSKLQQPEVGDRLRSFADTIEILEVSPPLYNSERKLWDRAVRFKVVKVHSPGDSSLDFQDESLLLGDLLSDPGYKYCPDYLTNPEAQGCEAQG